MSQLQDQTSARPYFAENLCPSGKNSVLLEVSPNLMRESAKAHKKGRNVKVCTKVIQKQTVYAKENNKTVKTKKMSKKCIKKDTKMHEKLKKNASFVSASTSASNATPKMYPILIEDEIGENAEKSTMKISDFFNSSQTQINAGLMENNLAKYKLEEVNFFYHAESNIFLISQSSHHSIGLKKVR